MDKVFIRELTAFASIGVYDWEHTIKQRLVFDIEMGWDFRQAVETEAVEYCLNYAEISQKILDFVENRPFKLVETVAYQVADLLQETYQIQSLKITLHKPKAVAEASSVGVIIERGTQH